MTLTMRLTRLKSPPQAALQGAHQLNGNRAGRLLAFFGADGSAELTLPDLAIFARQVAT